MYSSVTENINYENIIICNADKKRCNILLKQIKYKIIPL